MRPREGEIFLDGQPIHHVPRARSRRPRHRPSRRPPDFPAFDRRRQSAHGRIPAPRQDRHPAGSGIGVRPLSALEGARETVCRDLSGGEQQMLAMGRALMARPRLLLLDEPSMGLAPGPVDQIFEIIVRINKEQGTTILLVEQNALMALEVAARGLRAPVRHHRTGRYRRGTPQE
ncbi:MAG: ATP-binding cassette domain-containing protein [Chloroflexi bacterium]|nr:ATP-binding cassette domain-containing protein [Chloroflexota bacterium]